MVKLTDIEEEKPRWDLKELPDEIVLKAVDEKITEDIKDATGRVVKAGGIVIAFVDRQGKPLRQKYSKMHGRALKTALEKLGLKDTKDLQKDFYVYKLVHFRQGFPRLIPTAKAK
jgi:hypothetical protein